MLSAYPRRVAPRCVSHSEDCLDPKGAERFRLLAEDLLAKAAELQRNADGVSKSGHGQHSYGADGEPSGEG